jgi:hypothetical protein
VAGTTKNRNSYRLLVQMPEGKRPLGRARSRWVDGIHVDVTENGWGDVEWISLAHDRDNWRAFVNAVMNISVLKNAGQLTSGYMTNGSSSSSHLQTVKLVMYLVSYFSCRVGSTPWTGVGPSQGRYLRVRQQKN